MLFLITLIILYSLEEAAKSAISATETNYQNFLDDLFKF